MQKLSIKEIIGFRSKSDRSKKHFINTLKSDNPKPELEGGGDYWITSLSAIGNSYKSNNIEPIIEKRIELEEKYGETEHKKTKTMYKRNIDILYNYEDLNLDRWRPLIELKFIKKSKINSVILIKGLQIKATPNHVFTFIENNVNVVGAIWFIARLNGFEKSELGMFTDILHRYLKLNFSNDYSINTKYCIAVDVHNDFEVTFSQLENGEVPFLLNSTLDEMRRLF
jgi:hypothetical protein